MWYALHLFSSLIFSKIVYSFLPKALDKSSSTNMNRNAHGEHPHQILDKNKGLSMFYQ
jgi:hypothetical protein